MNEILKKLLESELLTEESKGEIITAFDAAVEKLKEDTRVEVELDVRAQLVEDWTKQRDALVDAVDKEVSTLVQEELTELRGDIERFRDLEVEYAEKIVEEKHKLKDQLYSELDTIVEALDEFLTQCITSEVEELKEDLDAASQNHFGRKVFEAFQSEFNKNYVSEDSVQRKLESAEAELATAQGKIQEMVQEKVEADRKSVMEEVLSTLSGPTREKMALILENVPTEKLSDAYELFIGKILKDDVVTESKKEKVTESAKKEKVKTKAKVKTEVVTGDEAPRARRKPAKAAVKKEAVTEDVETKSEWDALFEIAGVEA